MRRTRLLGVLAAGLILACGGGSTGGTSQLGALKNTVQVTFWHGLSGNLQAALNSLTDSFNSSQTTVHVNLVAKGSYTDLNKAVLTSLAAKQPPDLAQCIETDAAKYNQSKALADLTPYLNASDGLSSNDLKDYFPVMLNAAKIKGTYYQFPFNKSTTVLYYNQDLLNAAGINSPPATWDEFFTDAQKVVAAKPGVTGIEGPSIDVFLSELYENGGQMYDSANNPSKATVNSDAGIKAMTAWYNAIKAGYAKPLPAGNFADEVDFYNGKSAFYLSTQVSYQFIVGPIGNKFKFAEAPLPAGDKGVKDEMFGANMCAFANSSQDVKHGAFLYIKYLTNADNTATWAQKSSYMPDRQSAYKSLLSGFYSQNPNQGVGASMLNKGELIVLPSVPTSNEQRDALTTEINNIAAQRKDPKTGLNDAASKMNDILTTG